MAAYRITYDESNVFITRNGVVNTYSYNTLTAEIVNNSIFIFSGSVVLFAIDLNRDALIGFEGMIPTEIVYNINNIFNTYSPTTMPQVFVANNNADQAISTLDLIKFQDVTSVSGSISAYGANDDEFLLPEGYIYRVEFHGICNFSANSGKLLARFITDVDGTLSTQNIHRILPPTAPLAPSEDTTLVAYVNCLSTQKILSLEAYSIANINYLYGSSSTTIATLLINSI